MRNGDLIKPEDDFLKEIIVEDMKYYRINENVNIC